MISQAPMWTKSIDLDLAIFNIFRNILYPTIFALVETKSQPIMLYLKKYWLRLHISYINTAHNFIPK